MSGQPQPQPQPESLANLIDGEPYGAYERLTHAGKITWDDGVQAWLVPTYEGCTALLKDDITLYGPASERSAMRGNLRSTPVLTGDDHVRMRRWWLATFSPAAIDRYRTTIIQPIVDQATENVVSKHTSDMWVDVAQFVPIRVVASLLGLPWREGDWLDRVAEQLAILARPIDLMPHAPAEMSRAAEVAGAEIRAILMPLILEQQGRDGSSSLIGQLWQDGPTLLPEWSEDDVYAQALDMFVAGTDTTAIAIANAIYLLLTDADVRSTLADDGSLVPEFVEESLRLNPPVHFQVRVPREDVIVEDVPIPAGSSIIPLLAAANRDPSRWDCPHAARLDRSSAHLTFSYGRRRCLGAALARAEVQEVVRALLARTPQIELDPDVDPRLRGRLLRPYRPLVVTYED